MPAQRGVLAQRRLVGDRAGAHSHVAGARWWNRKHPREVRRRVGRGELARQDWEGLTEQDRHAETVMLRLRMRTGLSEVELNDGERSRAQQAVRSGLLDAVGGSFVLTDRGRLLADGVVRDILSG